jgi:carbohydrate diacid regulator
VKDVKHQLKTYTTDILKQLHRDLTFKDHAVVIGVSEEEYYIEELSRPFLPLKDFIRTATQLHKKSRLLFYEKNPMYMLLNQVPSYIAVSYVNMMLEKIDTKNGELVASLTALFENDLNVSRAAQSLGVHRHTLEYRLHTITKEVETNPLEFHNAVQFYLAILLKELYDL